MPDMTSNYVTDAEMASLSTRGQEQVKRAAHAHQAPAYSYGPVAGTVRCRRVGEYIYIRQSWSQ